MPRQIIPLMERFWKKVKMPDDPGRCWEWQASTRNGYGVIGLGGRKDGIQYSHILSYCFFYEFIEEGHEICHLCNNPLCVNPYHLYEGTRSQNMQQAFRDGRSWIPDRWNPGRWRYKGDYK